MMSSPANELTLQITALSRWFSMWRVRGWVVWVPELGTGVSSACLIMRSFGRGWVGIFTRWIQSQDMIQFSVSLARSMLTMSVYFVLVAGCSQEISISSWVLWVCEDVLCLFHMGRVRYWWFGITCFDILWWIVVLVLGCGVFGFIWKIRFWWRSWYNTYTTGIF
jgi:hypothetical protein